MTEFYTCGLICLLFKVYGELFVSKLCAQKRFGSDDRCQNELNDNHQAYLMMGEGSMPCFLIIMKVIFLLGNCRW